MAYDYGTGNFAHWVTPGLLNWNRNEDKVSNEALKQAVESLQKSADVGGFQGKQTNWGDFNPQTATEAPDVIRQGMTSSLTPQGDMAAKVGGQGMVDSLQAISNIKRIEAQENIYGKQAERIIKVTENVDKIINTAFTQKEKYGAGAQSIVEAQLKAANLLLGQIGMKADFSLLDDAASAREKMKAAEFEGLNKAYENFLNAPPEEKVRSAAILNGIIGPFQEKYKMKDGQFKVIEDALQEWQKNKFKDALHPNIPVKIESLGGKTREWFADGTYKDVAHAPNPQQEGAGDKASEKERRNKISDLKQFILREETNRQRWAKALETGNFDPNAKPAEGETANYYTKYNKTIGQFDDNILNAKQQLISL